MSRARRGVSLVEVLVAVLLLSIGLAPVGYGLVYAVREAGRAEARSRLSLAMNDLLASLQRMAAQTSPPCLLLTAGAEDSGGIEQRWTVSDSAGFRLVLIRGRVALPGRPLEDSLRSRIRCP
jgi:prepilin-type N-terminal cleavage/methylation domain-containing protein